MAKRTSFSNPLGKYFSTNKGRLIDKWTHYFDIYHQHFARFRSKRVTIVEFGVYHGGSLQMWKHYFGPNARVIGIDINPDCKVIEEEQIEILIGDQEDKDFLAEVSAKAGPVDVLIDDGGHTMSQQLSTFSGMFPTLKSNGVYLVEDLHTSYWKEYGGAYGSSATFIEFAKRLIDQMHAWHSRDAEELKVTYYTRHLKAMHVYDSVIVFDKAIVAPPHARKTGKPAWTTSEESGVLPDSQTSNVYAKVFTPKGGVIQEELSTTVELVAGEWRRLKFELPWGLGDGNTPLRFDPTDRAGIVDIAAVSLRSRATSEFLWRTTRREGLKELRTGGTSLRLPHQRLLKLFSYGEDPQIYLPSLSGEEFEEPLTFEAWLRFDPSREAMERAVIALNITIETAADLVLSAQAAKPLELAAPEAGTLGMVNSETVSIRVYAASASGYVEDQALEVPYTLHRWSHLHIALEHGLGKNQLRFDPLVTPGLIDIAGVALKSAVTGDVIWKANGDGGLDNLVAGGSAIRIPHPRLARIFSYGEDPQIYLPLLSGAEYDGPLRLELWLKVETGAEGLRAGLIDITNASARAVAQAGEAQALLEATTHSLSDQDAEARSRLEEFQATLRERDEALANASEAANREKATAEDAVAKVTEELSRTHESLALKTRELESRNSELEQVRQGLAVANDQLGGRNSELEQAREDWTAAKRELGMRMAELAHQRRESEVKNDEVAIAADKLNRSEKERASMEKKIESQRRVIEAGQRELASKQSESESRIRELHQLSNELAATTFELTEVAAELAELKRQFVKYTKKFEKQLQEKSSWTSLLSHVGATGKTDDSEDASVDIRLPSRTFWLEHPTGPTPDGRPVNIAGWALSATGEKVEGVRAVINGETFVAQHAAERRDVGAAYPDNPNAEYSGFSVDVDLPLGTTMVSLERLSKGRWEKFSAFQHEVRPS